MGIGAERAAERVDPSTSAQSSSTKTVRGSPDRCRCVASVIYGPRIETGLADGATACSTASIASVRCPRWKLSTGRLAQQPSDVRSARWVRHDRFLVMEAVIANPVVGVESSRLRPSLSIEIESLASETWSRRPVRSSTSLMSPSADVDCVRRERTCRRCGPIGRAAHHRQVLHPERTRQWGRPGLHAQAASACPRHALLKSALRRCAAGAGLLITINVAVFVAPTLCAGLSR